MTRKFKDINNNDVSVNELINQIIEKFQTNKTKTRNGALLTKNKEARTRLKRYHLRNAIVSSLFRIKTGSRHSQFLSDVYSSLTNDIVLDHIFGDLVNGTEEEQTAVEIFAHMFHKNKLALDSEYYSSSFKTALIKQAKWIKENEFDKGSPLSLLHKHLKKIDLSADKLVELKSLVISIRADISQAIQDVCNGVIFTLDNGRYVMSGIKDEQLLKQPLKLSQLEIAHKKAIHSNGDTRKAIDQIRQMQFTFDLDYCKIVEKLVSHPDVIEEQRKKAEEAQKQFVFEEVAQYTIDRIRDYRKLNKEGITAFYSDWKVDQRGRIYMRCLGANSTESELSKSMLRASEKVALGPNGFNEILFYTATVIDDDKTSFNARVDRVMNELPELEQIGRELLEGDFDMFLLTKLGKVEKPWYLINCLIELARIAEHREAGKPVEEFKSDLLLARDGTCNVVQIVSNLMGSVELARHGNCLTSSKDDNPYDFYKLIIDAVEETIFKTEDKVYKDIPKISKLYHRGLSKKSELNLTDKKLNDYLNRYLEVSFKKKRKYLAKKISMTMPYGAADRGQIKRTKAFVENCVKLSRNKNGELSKKGEFEAKSISRLVFRVFEEAMKTNEACKTLHIYRAMTMAIGRSYATKRVFPWWKVDGTTPVQPVEFEAKDELRVSTYDKKGFLVKTRIYDTSPLSDMIKQEEMKGGMIYKKAKIKSSFGANRIHSTDAIILYRTVLGMNGQTLRLTHDSLACVAGHMDTMKELLEKQYLRLHPDQLRLDIERAELICGEDILWNEFGKDAELIREWIETAQPIDPELMVGAEYRYS